MGLPQGGSPAAASRFHPSGKKAPARLAFADLLTPKVSYIKALAGSIAIARALRGRWAGQANVGVLLPASVGGCSRQPGRVAGRQGRGQPQLHHRPGRHGIGGCTGGTQDGRHQPRVPRKGKLEPPQATELIYLEDVMRTITKQGPADCAGPGDFCPDPYARTLGRGGEDTRRSTTRPPSSSAAAARASPRGSSCRTSISIPTSRRSPRFIACLHERPTDRHPAALSLVRLHDVLVRGQLGDRDGLPSQPARRRGDRLLVERYRVTILLATPTFLQLYMRRCTPAQFGSIRLVLAGAEKLPESMALAFEDTFGIRPMEGYGLTECSPVVAVNTFDWREPGFFQPGSRRGYVGPAAARRLGADRFDAKRTSRSGPITPGLVLVKGPNVMQGYLGRDDLTRAAFRDGWYVTGDQGFLSEDGFLKITGRLSRFSKIGGEMVPHGLIEESLQQASGADEQVFAVTAVGDERKGEKLVVLHTLDDAKVDQALERLGSQGLPNLFIPRRDNFIKVDKLPMLGTGKLDLSGMRRVAENAINNKEAVRQ